MAFGESSPAVNQREPFIAGYADDEELVEGVRRGDVFAVRDLGGLERISFPRVDLMQEVFRRESVNFSRIGRV